MTARLVGSQTTAALLEKYREQNQIAVVEKDVRKIEKLTRAQVIWDDFSSDNELLRHDGLKLARQFKKMLDEDKKT